MENSVDSLCVEMIKNVQKESDNITKQIKNFYIENKKNKELTENTFQEQITDFKSKYLNASAATILPKGEEFDFIELNNDCSKKLKIVVDEFVNYIDSLE